MPVITSAFLEKGGCFDINGDYNCPHITHKMGHNVDISLNLKSPWGDEVYYNILQDLRDIIRELYSNSGSFCQIHNNNHFHCRFYNGWYN